MNLDLTNCMLCPRSCKVNREAGERGYCKAPAAVLAARAALHFWEEPCLSGIRGSGAVFFSTCTMRCVFCQNHEISADGVGYPIDEKRLADIFLHLQAEGAHNINLVSPTPFLPKVVKALEQAKNQGMTLPVLMNSGGYESVETIRALDGLIDIYLPDYKYASEKLAVRYSKAPFYPEIAKSAIDEMVRQTGEAVFDETGIMLKGTIIRHLMLPDQIEDTKAVIRLVAERYAPKGAYFSLMNQYTPMNDLSAFPELNQPIDPLDYRDAVSYASFCGIEHGFIQEGGTVSESFVPGFHGEGIL